MGYSPPGSTETSANAATVLFDGCKIPSIQLIGVGTANLQRNSAQDLTYEFEKVESAHVQQEDHLGAVTLTDCGRVTFSDGQGDTIDCTDVQELVLSQYEVLTSLEFSGDCSEVRIWESNSVDCAVSLTQSMKAFSEDSAFRRLTGSSCILSLARVEVSENVLMSSSDVTVVRGSIQGSLQLQTGTLKAVSPTIGTLTAQLASLDCTGITATVAVSLNSCVGSIRGVTCPQPITINTSSLTAQGCSQITATSSALTTTGCNVIDLSNSTVMDRGSSSITGTGFAQAFHTGAVSCTHYSWVQTSGEWVIQNDDGGANFLIDINPDHD